MAEAFLALGVAANIAQFISYGIKLLAEGKEAYGSIRGQQDEHHELETIIADIKGLSDEVASVSLQTRVATIPLSSDERIIVQLVTECQPLADKLQRLLDDLKVSKGARLRGLQTSWQTLKGGWKKSDIQDLRRRLLDIDERLRFRVSNMLQK